MFFLDKPKAASSYIMLNYKCADGRLRYSTAQTVDPTNWDAETGRVLKDKKAINAHLDRIEAAMHDLERRRNLSGQPLTRLKVRQALDQLLGRGKKAEFFEQVEAIIAARESGDLLTERGKLYSKHTIKSLRHSLSNLKSLADTKGLDLNPAKVTMATFDKVVAHLTAAGYALNTISKTVQHWRSFLKMTHKAGFHENVIYLSSDFWLSEEETNHISLKLSELDLIYQCKLEDKFEDIVRDRFIIDAFIGLRISDMQTLDKKHLKNAFIRKANEKTDAVAMTPLHPYVKAIIKKWNGLPPKISEQAMNRLIKEVARKAGLTDVVLFVRTEGGKRKEHYRPKYEMIHNHTMRRSCITNMRKAGMETLDIMHLLGIKKPQTVMRYDKEPVHETAERLADHPFFNPGTGLKAV